MKKMISVLLMFLLMLVLLFPTSAETEKTVPVKTGSMAEKFLPCDFPDNSDCGQGIGAEINVMISGFTGKTGSSIQKEIEEPLKGDFSNTVIRALDTERMAETLVYVPDGNEGNITDLAENKNIILIAAVGIMATVISVLTLVAILKTEE